MTYPKRLIEVDLPIRRISDHARREKAVRHGHISTLHIWWARRPLAACRAVICASLWPDPADPGCPSEFRKTATEEMRAWTTHERQTMLSEESRQRFERARKRPDRFNDPAELRGALLDFIADFANWDNSTQKEFLQTTHALTRAAHECLSEARGSRPLVIDPFAGGGSIPFEAARVGADAFASDLNPIPVLLNKVALQFLPKFGPKLANEVRRLGALIRDEAEKDLARFYPRDNDGGIPIAYLWARTITCEGPGCGAEVPLVRSLWLGKKSNRSTALQIVPRPRAKRVGFKIIVKRQNSWVEQADPKEKVKDPNFAGTVQRGSATCPCCGYTTPLARIREQLRKRHGGARDSRLMAVATVRPGAQGRFYRLPSTRDFHAIEEASKELMRRRKAHKGSLALVPDEPTPEGGGAGAGRAFSQRSYGMDTFGDLYTSRQALALSTLCSLVSKVCRDLDPKEPELATAVQTLLALAVGRLADRSCSLCTWRPQADQEKVEHVFTRHALPMTWDFAEGNFLSEQTAGWTDAFEPPCRVVETESGGARGAGEAVQASATEHPLPDDSAAAFITDPPYYDAVPYSDLSDFFYVWLRRALPATEAGAYSAISAPKADECIVDEVKGKDREYFVAMMKRAMAEGRRVLAPTGIGVVVFAHKSTAGWEAQLQAMIDAGWIVTGSWPIDTEMGTRLRAMGSAALASSVHLVCRPRENPDGSIRNDQVGDWRDVLQELPTRIHDWMPRLAKEGVVGADAIFACLGPALEIFSRYSRVEKGSGEAVSLKDYLEQVWAAVAKEALSMIFAGADATGYEEDSRLTAMWLWTLKTGNGHGGSDGSAEGGEEEEGSSVKAAKATGFTLEYDAARKIGQGLGAHLEDLQALVEVTGETARLLSVSERARYLFGKDEGRATPIKRKRDAQLDLFKPAQTEEDGETSFGETKVERIGQTVLDRIHQSMILFAAGRTGALKRFVVEDGAGKDPRFWTLAQALSALYPGHSEEKRWVDGVLARKKALGF